MPDENVPSNDPASADITPVSLDNTPVAPAGVSMPDRPKELRAEDYGRDKPNFTQDDGSLGFFDNIRYSLFTRKIVMFSKIETLFGGISGLISGNYQTTITSFLQFFLASANIPANVENALSTVVAGIAVAVMHKQNILTVILGYSLMIVTILQWATSLFPDASPFHTPLAMLAAALIVFMKDKGAQVTATN